MKYQAIEYVLPSVAVSNAEILARIEDESRAHLSPGELERVLRGLRLAFRSMGTDVRYRCGEGERPFELCVEAGQKALASAGMSPSDIDLLIYVGVGRGFVEPATANVFQDLLGLSKATCFDVLDACASWIRAAHIARAFFEAGTYRNAMIVNAEFNANYEHYQLRSGDEFNYLFPAFTIGEAATATIVSSSDGEDEHVTEFQSFGEQRSKCIIPLPNWSDYLGTEVEGLEPFRFVSYGHEIMQFGLAELTEQFTRNPDFHDFDPEIVFFHSASDGMARDGMRRCGLAEDLGYYAHCRFGNTVSATLPLAMAAASEEGRLRDGTRVLLAVASAGISTALSRFVYRT